MKKKLALCILSFVFAFLSVSFISCQTSKISTQKTQTYEDPYSEEKIRGTKSFTQQILNTQKYQKIGSSSLFTKSFLGKITQRQITLIHKPQTDLMGFLVHYDTSLYTFYMAQGDRMLFVNAVENFLSDVENGFFENQVLNGTSRKTGRKTESFYGNALCFQEFGIVEAMLNNYSKPKVLFGYTFLDDFPYFTLTVKSSKNLQSNIGSNAVQKSIEQKYYFNKEQVKTLQDFFLTHKN